MRTVTSVFFVGASLLIACTAEDPNTSTASQNVETFNKLATNKLATNMLTASSLLSTPDGREVYSYLIGCAVPAGTTIEATIPGAPDVPPSTANYTCSGGVCDFDGVVGLAPHWLDHTPTERDLGWVSACLFARCNAHNTAEEISLRGDASALSVGVDEAAIYTLEEAAFYGDMFTPDNQPIDWNACLGRDKAAGNEGGLADRDCAVEDPSNPGYTICGFKYAGHCGNYSTQFPTPYACSQFETDPNHASFYDSCYNSDVLGRAPTHHDDDHGDRDHINLGGHHDLEDDDNVYHQVITTFVAP